MLAIAGCGVGLLLGAWTRHALVALAPAGTPRIETATLDLRVLVFTIVLSFAATILFGTLPAWQTSVRAGEAPRQARGPLPEPRPGLE